MQETTVAEKSSKIFADVREVDITRAIANEFHEVLIDRADSDVIIIGAGPAGLCSPPEQSYRGSRRSPVRSTLRCQAPRRCRRSRGRQR